MALKQDGMYFVLCPRLGNIIEGDVLNRVCISGFFCPKQSQGFKPSVAHRYPNIGRLPTPPGVVRATQKSSCVEISLQQN